MSNHRVGLNIVRMFIAVCLIAGLGLFFVSLARFTAVKPLVDSLSADGTVESFTLQTFSNLLPLFRLSGVALLLAGVGIFLFRSRFAVWMEQAPKRVRCGASRLGSDFRILLGEFAGLRSDGVFLAGLAGVTTLGLVVRLVYINQPMRYDEAYTYLVFAVRPLKFIVTDYHVPNNHVFHTLLVALSTRLFGGAPWAIRLPAFLGGVLLIPSSYLLARQRHTPAVGLLAAAFVAANSFLIEYSTDARGYILMALATVWIIALAAYANKRSNVAAWGLFCLVSALAFYTLPTTLYPFGGVMVWSFLVRLLERRPLKESWMAYLGLLLVGGIVFMLTLWLYLPIIRNAGLGALTANRFVSPLDWGDFLQEFPGSLVSTWRGFTRDMPPGLGLLLIGGILASFVLRPRQRRDHLLFVVSMLGWCMLLVTIQRVAPWARVWIFLMPLFLIWASVGWVSIYRAIRKGGVQKWQPAWIVSIVLFSAVLCWGVVRSGGVLASTQTGTLAAAPEIIRDYIQASQPGDVIVSDVPSNYPLRYYAYYYDLPEDRLYLPRYGDDFERALVVVNTLLGPDFERVIEKWRIAPYLDLATTRLWKEFPGAEVYLVDRKE